MVSEFVGTFQLMWPLSFAIVQAPTVLGGPRYTAILA